MDPQPEPPPRDEPIVEPIDFIVQPSVVSPPNRPGRRTNQLQYLHNCINAVWNDTSAEPFRQPADAKNMPVSLNTTKPDSYLHTNVVKIGTQVLPFFLPPK